MDRVFSFAVVFVAFVAVSGARANVCPPGYEPARWSKSAVRGRLEALTPDLPKSTVDDKIRNSSTAFEFFRATVPLFYDVLACEAKAKVNLAPLRRHLGWCAGNPHLENFGVQIFVRADADFVITDIDHTATCPLGADFLRYLAGVELAKPGTDLRRLFAEYAKRISGRPPITESTPAIVRAMIEKALQKGTAPDPDLLEKNGARLVRDAQTVEVPTKLKNEIQDAISENLPFRFQIQDMIEAKRDHGGSAGRRRFLVLMRIEGAQNASTTRDLILELKEKAAPATWPLEAPRNSNYEAILKTFGLPMFARPSPFYSAVTLEGDAYQMRPKFDGNNSVSLTKLSDSELDEIMVATVRLLADLHRENSDDVVSYRSAISSWGPARAEVEARRLADLFRTLYDRAR